MRTVRHAFALLCLLLASSAAAQAGAPGPSERLAALTRRYLDGLFRAKPHLATYMGVHDQDGALPDLSASGVKRRVAELTAQQRELAALDRQALSPDGRIDAAILSDGIGLELLELTAIREWTWNPRLVDDFTFYDPREVVAGRLSDVIHGDFAPEPVRRRAVAAQLRALPRYLSQRKVAFGAVSKVHLEQAVKDNKGRIEFFETEVRGFTRADPAAEQARVKAVAALRDYQRFLETALPKRATRDWRLGPALYRKKFPLALQTDLRPDEDVVPRARQAFQETRRALYETAVALAAQLWPSEPPPPKDLDAAGQARLIARVKDELSKEHPAAADLVASHARQIDGLRAFIEAKGLLALPPADTLTVAPEPEFKRGGAGAEYLSPGMLDKEVAWKGTYYVEPVDPSWSKEKQESYLRAENRYEVALTAAHEAYPGHHTQAWYARKDLSPLRATLWDGAFAEGWAVYGTTLLVREGFGAAENARYRFLDLQGSMIVAANALLDIQLQGGAMTDAEALRFMVEDGFQERAQAEKKLLRAKLDSTQLCQYFLGSSELAALERDVRAKGPFSQRAFDEALVGHGTIAVKHLRRYLLGP
ncbi:DUF885 domain-containing protein [Anaeromyxobacter paludicola]|uniref:DUF885 domain-containing protein n=1 Tax=Anaeromyxobacter paludicola TaxID=2918171 RepID=A0ABN6N8F8_9BACT|nr:DUF885 domain-containing protein [Anaeromyxobacter paludicola]BDG09500.1 hypothetical protein AMPC_26130 [Anaeromyxobacter paludicola]